LEETLDDVKEDEAELLVVFVLLGAEEENPYETGDGIVAEVSLEEECFVESFDHDAVHLDVETGEDLLICYEIEENAIEMLQGHLVIEMNELLYDHQCGCHDVRVPERFVMIIRQLMISRRCWMSMEITSGFLAEFDFSRSVVHNSLR
jgi:hypothetical protein